MTFQLEAGQLLVVLDPLAKSITCLESSHSTASDVYLFWMAIMATYHDIFNNNVWRLPEYVIESVRRIVNYRYNEMVTGPQKDIYVTAFFLNPSKHNSFDVCAKLC